MRQVHIDTLDTISIIVTDKDGNPVPVSTTGEPGKAHIDAAPVWSNSDATTATLVPAADGLTALLTPLKVDGVTTVTVQVSIDGTVFNATDDYTVISGAVAAIALKDTFTPKP